MNIAGYETKGICVLNTLSPMAPVRVRGIVYVVAVCVLIS